MRTDEPLCFIPPTPPLPPPQNSEIRTCVYSGMSSSQAGDVRGIFRKKYIGIHLMEWWFYMWILYATIQTHKKHVMVKGQLSFRFHSCQ